jgi:hypothetical protein
MSGILAVVRQVNAHRFDDDQVVQRSLEEDRQPQRHLLVSEARRRRHDDLSVDPLRTHRLRQSELVVVRHALA